MSRWHRLIGTRRESVDRGFEQRKGDGNMKMELRKTERGFARCDFVDRYGFQCSIQESSLATEYAIWLGVTENRMHLTQEMAEALIPLLQKFVETGELS